MFDLTMPPTLAPAVKLNSGHLMPQIGLGLGTFASKDGCTEAIKSAMLAGYRYFSFLHKVAILKKFLQTL